MLLDDSTPCWGRAGADICAACARLQTPAEYTGGFPVMNLLVPGARLEETRDGGLQWFCAERRSAGTPRPAAVCAAAVASVCAEGYCVHQRTVEPNCHQGKPLTVGGARCHWPLA
jgi:hypothetical protein